VTDYTDHSHVLEILTESQSADSDNRDNAREATLFISKRDGQWEPYWWDACDGKPRYTFDMTGPVVDQISGEMEQADFDISVKPAGGDTTKDDAKLFDGMIRNIENISNAKDIFNLSGRNMVCGGFDAWQIKQKYVDDDSFDQDLVIEGISNALDSVWLGPFKKPDASDMTWGIVLEAIDKRKYDEKWPEGSGMSVSEDRTSQAYYNKADQIIIGQIYFIEEVDRELLLMSSGRVLENNEDNKKILDELAENGETVEKTRTRPKNVVKSRLFDGKDWLGKEQTTVFNQVPIIPCLANFRVFENKVLYWGSVEKQIDAQRVFNYAKSREIEEGALAPRAKYWMTEKQIAGHETTLATMNTNSDPIQLYNHDAQVPGQPQQSGGAQINPGLQTISSDMNGILRQTAGLFAANMGDNPNAQSGVALKKLQDKGDTGTIKYFKAMERAIGRTGRILVDAIPVVYDTQRQVRIMKEDGSFDMTAINEQVLDDETGTYVMVNDVSKGKYDVTCSSGPAFQNRQEETVAAITEMATIDPSILEMGGDILFNNLASPGMDLLAARKRQQIYSAGMIPFDQQTDEEKQQTQQAQQQPPPEDPMMVAAQAEAEKAKAANNKIMVEAQAIERREARADYETQMKQQKQEYDMAMGQAKDSQEREKLQYDWDMQRQRLTQDWQATQFDQMMRSQQALYQELSSQVNSLKTYREAMGADAVSGPALAAGFGNQLRIVSDSQREQE